MANLSQIKLPNGTTYDLKDNNALPLTGGSVTGPVSFGDSVSIDEATVGDLVVNGSASFTNNIQANTINGVEVGSSPKFTDTNTVTTATTTGSGNAVTAVTASNGALTITKGTTFLTSHQDISGKADKTATVSNVAYDSTNKKITKTINGTTSDVVTVATLKTALGSMPASDVYSWAKASTKPSYAYSEITGTVPSSALPSYVDDVLEYSAKSSFPATGETGKIYVDTSTNLTWRWGGSTYVEISPSLALGTTSSTAYRGDYGNTAYTHATDANRLTTAKTSGLYKIATTAHGHVQSVTAVAKADITALGIPAQDTTYESKAAASGGTAVSLVTTGEKYTWNNKIGATTPTIATDTGTSTVTLASAGKYKLTAGGGSVIFTMPTIPTVNYPVTSVNSKTGAVSLTAADVGALASNTTYVSKITTTAGAHTTISNKSGAVSFNIPTKTSHLTNDSGFLTSVANDSHNHSPDTIYIPTNYARTGSLDLFSATKIGSYMSNKSFAIPPEAITIEYSTDGGSTWQDYGATDLHKQGLFAETRNNCNTFLGKATTKEANSLNNQLRITISRINLGRYTAINSFYTWMTTNGNTVYCKLERSLNSSPTAFETVFTDFKLAGWSGHNIRYFPTMAFGGGNDNQPYAIRLTVWQTAITTNYPSANLYDIRFYGPDTYSASAPYYKVQTNELYTWDNALNAIFPAGITATSFNGNLTGNVTGNVSGSAGSVAWSGVTGKPTSTGSKVTGITASTTATKTTLGTAFTIPNVTSAGSASTWAFEEISIPNVTSAGSASTWAFEEKTIPNVTSAGSASTWTFGATTVGDGTLVGTVDSSDTSMLVITAGTKSVQQKTGGGNGTAPTLGTAIKVQSKKSGANSTAPTLGTAIKVQSKKSGANGSAPTLGTAFTVPNVTGNTSATVSITDPGHTHSI